MTKFLSLNQAVKLVKENKKLIFLMLTILFVMAVYGYMQPDILKEQQQEIIDTILGKVEDKSAVEVTLFIMFHNIRSTVIAVLLGIIFYPIIDVVANGYFIGAVLNSAVAETSYYVMWRLVPHGVFEIPAIAIAAAFGLRVGLALFKKEKKKNIVKAYKEAFLVLITVVIPLLIIAGVIEGMLFHFLKG